MQWSRASLAAVTLLLGFLNGSVRAQQPAAAAPPAVLVQAAELRSLARQAEFLTGHIRKKRLEQAVTAFSQARDSLDSESSPNEHRVVARNLERVEKALETVSSQNGTK